MEKRRSELGSLVVHESVQGLNSWRGFNGSSHGEDLRKAYTETVVPVSEEDFVHREKYRTVDELNRARARALDNLDYEAGRREQAQIEAEQSKEDIARYYDQLSLLEKNTAKVSEFNKKILRLRN
jgi:hypothetical protein